MAGTLKVGGNTIATHTGVEGAGTVTLSATQLNGMDVVKTNTNTDPFGDSSQIRFFNFQEGASDVMGNGDGYLLHGANISRSPLYGLTDERAMYVDGNTYMSMTGISTNTFSVSFWVQGSNFDTNNFIGILGNQGDGYGQICTQPNSSRGNTPELTIYENADFFFSQQHILANHTLHHLVWTANSGTDKMYLNNVDIGSSGATVSLNPTMRIGTASTQLSNRTYGMRGYFRNIRIFNKQLSAAEVNTLYTGKL